MIGPNPGLSLPMLSAQLAQLTGQVKAMQQALVQTTISRDVFAAALAVTVRYLLDGEKFPIVEGNVGVTRERLDAARKAWKVEARAAKVKDAADADPNAVAVDMLTLHILPREEKPVLQVVKGLAP